jgi:hypothetical protein
MFPRFLTGWRAFSVVLLSLAAVTWPSASWASSTPNTSFLGQDGVVTLGASAQATLHIDLTVPAGAQVHVSLYPRVTARSQLTPFLTQAGAPTTSNTALACGGRAHVFSVTLAATGAGLNPCGRTNVVHLYCAGASCAGVYPLRIAVESPQTTTWYWSLVSVRAAKVTHPLAVSYVATLTTPTVRAADTVGALGQLGELNAPLTLATNYQTLGALEKHSPTDLRQAFSRALQSPLHRVLDSPPGTIDFGGLVSNGFTAEAQTELQLTNAMVNTLAGRYTDAPLVLSGWTSLSSLNALAGEGVTDVVVPEGQLTPAPSSTLTWGTPYHPFGAASLSALSPDGPLDTLLSSSLPSTLRGVLAAQTLNFLYFEAPGDEGQRSVVLESPVTSANVSAASTLFQALRHDPYVTVSSLSPLFNSANVGANGAPTSRTLLQSPTPSEWSAHNDATLASLEANVSSFAQAITSAREMHDLNVLVAESAIVGSASARQVLLDHATAVLNSQLHQFSIDNSSITLAGTGSSIPITLLSQAPYPVTAVVHLVTDRLSFPKGATMAVTLDSPTKSIRIPVSDRGRSSLTLQVYVTTPDGALTLARTALQVRIAGTSAVGYVLTGLSLLVLAVWWLRTARRRRAGQGRGAK